MDDDGGQIGVKHRGAKGVLETSDKDRFINEGIERPAKTAPLQTQSGPARGGCPRDNQDLEIRPMSLHASERRRHHVGNHSLPLLMRLPIVLVLAVGPCENGTRNMTGKRRGRVSVVRLGTIP